MALLGFALLAGAQNYAFSNDLSLGSRGSDVSALQTWLIGNGFAIPSVSSGPTAKGYFGQQTQAALAAYQRSVGIPAYGYFGPQTRAKLNASTNGNGGSSLQVTSPNGGETWVKGTTQYITWSGASNMFNQTADIKLEFPLPSCAQPGQPIRCMIMVRAPYVLVSGVNLNSRSYAWTVGMTYDGMMIGNNCDPVPGYSCPAGSQGTNYPISDGQYKIQICPTNGSQCAESTAVFTVTSNPQATGNSPVINGVDAPTSLSVGQTGTWTVHATDPYNGTLSYSVDWGDANSCPSGYTCAANAAVPAAVTQATTFTHAYSTSGVFTPKFTVRNASGLTAQSSATVNVTGSTAAGPLRVTSPNGGEVWQRGTVQNIAWTSPYYFAAATVDLRLSQYIPQCFGPAPCATAAAYPIATNVNANQNSYSWNVGNIQANYIASMQSNYSNIQDGQYIIQICQSGTDTCDSSDAPFTITSGTTSNSPITVVSPNGGETWYANSVHQITWNYLNAQNANSRFDLYLASAFPCPVNSNCQQIIVNLDKNVSNTPYNWIAGTDMYNSPIQPGAYTLNVCLSGTSTCSSSNSTFNIAGTAVPAQIPQPNACPVGYTCQPQTVASSLLRACPSQVIINQMPAYQSYSNQNLPSTYYIYNGQRHELSEFDQAWVAGNCNIPVQQAY